MKRLTGQIAIGLVPDLGVLALIAFFGYANGEAFTRLPFTHSVSAPLWSIAGFAVFGLLLAGTSAWSVLQNLRRGSPRSLVKTEELYRELCDSAFDLIDMLSPDLKFLYTNASWQQTLGYTAEEACQLRLVDVVHPEDWESAQRGIRGLMAGEPGRNPFEVRFRARSGTTVYLEGTVNCRREKGKPVVIRGILRDITERKRAEQVLHKLQQQLEAALTKEHELARIDPLTHVSNRRAFYEQAEIEIVRARRNHRALSVAYMDIDNFKLVNDALGHATGDAVLVTIASTLRQELRASDIVARMGGDEFAILLPETDAESAQLVLDKLRAELLATVNENGWDVTFSIGAATFAEPPESLEAMIRVADDAMYSIKAGGKNNISVVFAR